MTARIDGALFLDRDGVINVDRGYVHRIDQFEFMPGIFELVRFAAHDLGWPVIVTTNQAGIGRGYFDEDAYRSLTDWMRDRFRAEGAPLAAVYHCPFHPVHGVGIYRADHEWRKPKPGMILQAAADFNLDLSKSALIGDKISDIQAAAAAGIDVRMRLNSGETALDIAAPPHIVIRNLQEALPILRKHRAIGVRAR